MFYARLKEGVKEAPRYGVFLYPGDKYRQVEDRYRELVEKDDRVEILSVEEMAEINRKKQELIKEIVFGHWKSGEKIIAEMTDLDELAKVEALAKANGKNKIVELAQYRIEELTPSK